MEMAMENITHGVDEVTNSAHYNIRFTSMMNSAVQVGYKHLSSLTNLGQAQKMKEVQDLGIH